MKDWLKDELMIIQYISLETNDGTAVNIDDVETDGTILC